MFLLPASCRAGCCHKIGCAILWRNPPFGPPRHAADYAPLTLR